MPVLPASHIVLQADGKAFYHCGSAKGRWQGGLGRAWKGMQPLGRPEEDRRMVEEGKERESEENEQWSRDGDGSDEGGGASGATAEDDYGEEEWGAEEESEEEDERWDANELPLFTTHSTRRVFEVSECVRIVGGFRPSAELRGELVEVGGVSPHEQLSLPPRCHANARVVHTGLTLQLRYEPPSPKFSRKRPECASYRLTLLRGIDFLYSTRGLHTHIVYSRKPAFAVWGNLELFFSQPFLLERVLSCLKHVKASNNLELLSSRSAPLQDGSPLPPDPIAEEHKLQLFHEKHRRKVHRRRRLLLALSCSAAGVAALASLAAFARRPRYAHRL